MASKTIHIGVYQEDNPQARVNNETFIQSENGGILLCGGIPKDKTTYYAFGLAARDKLKKSRSGLEIVVIHPGKTNDIVNTSYPLVDNVALQNIAKGVGEREVYEVQVDLTELPLPQRGVNLPI